VGGLDFLSSVGITFQSDDYKIVVVEKPKYTLTAEQQETIIRLLQKPSSEGFGHHVREDSLRKRILQDQEYLLLPVIDEQLVGFGSASFMEEPGFLYYEGVVISLEAQGKGIGSRLMKILVRHSACTSLVFTTQSPVMYLLLHRISRVIYPDLHEESIPRDIQKVGTQFMRRRQGEFDGNSFVAHNLYPHCLYTKYPWCGITEIDSFFKRKLHFIDEETNDGFLLIGMI